MDQMLSRLGFWNKFVKFEYQLNLVESFAVDHPSREWFDPKTGNLKEGKRGRTSINHNFKFYTCRDAKELEDCFIWEYNRTREFIGWKYPKKYRENIKSAFPFSLNETEHWKGVFPAKPYLSILKKARIELRGWREEQYMSPRKKSKKDHSEVSSSELAKKDSKKGGKVSVRTRFSSLRGEEYSERNFEKLLVPSHQPCEKFPHYSFKVPVELYINPRWGKTKTSKLFREQWAEIDQQLELNKKDYERAGFVFALGVDEKEAQEGSYKTKLKLLGYIRLLYCVGLDFDNLPEVYGKGAYEEKAIFLKEVRKFKELEGLMKKIIKHFGR